MPGSAKRNSHIARAWPCPASSGRLARLVVALGAIRFACTGRQRASAGPQSRATTPPALVPRSAPDRSCRAAAPSLLRRAQAKTRRVNQGAGARAQVRPRQRLLLECSEPMRASRWSSEVSGDAAASATDARRTSGCCRSSGSLPNAIRQAPPTASASGTHNWSQRFVAVVLVLVRQVRTREVGLAARRHAITERVAAL
jgi:hypothetical protein